MHKKKLFGTFGELPDDGVYPLGIVKKVVFGPNNWAEGEGFVLRCYTMGPGKGPVSLHEHPWAHWSIIHSGTANVVIGDEKTVLPAGSWVHVPIGVKHTYYNASDKEELVFLCIVRPEGDVNPAPTAKNKGFC